jgi:hypothetical protein
MNIGCAKHSQGNLFWKFFRILLVLLGHKSKHLGVELFCGITPLYARPTRETLRGIYRGLGDGRGARRPARTFEELLQGIVIAR